MNYFFIVQGEGRGHMTQSVALSEILEERGHRVERVFLGVSPQREVPGFYRDYFGERLRYFRSPNFLRTADRKGIRVTASIFYNLLLIPVFLVSVIRLVSAMRKTEAAVIVNFYDMLGGLARTLSFSGKKTVVLSHHFFFESPAFPWPAGKRMMRFFLRLHSRLTSLRAGTVIALSFTPGENSRRKRFTVAPPLISRRIKSLKPTMGSPIFVYLLNEGFLDDVFQVGRGGPRHALDRLCRECRASCRRPSQRDTGTAFPGCLCQGHGGLPGCDLHRRF